MNKIFTPNFLFVIFIILAAATTRLLPHWDNFTAIGAMALFAGANVRFKPLAIMIPIGAMLVSDLVIGFHNIMLYVYAAVFAGIILGVIIRNNQSILPVAFSAISYSIIFFLVTNFAIWPGNALYTQDLSGLVNSYMSGIPFFRNELTGTLVYSAVIFSSYHFALRKFPVLAVEYKR